MKKPHKQSYNDNNSPERKSRGRQRDEASSPVPPGRRELPESYAIVFDEIKTRIRTERVRIAMAANAAMVLLYWDIGRVILERQEDKGWGAKVIDRLSSDLRNTFPDIKGTFPA